MTRLTRVLALLALGLIPDAASAQSLGTFRWQLQPFCNVITVLVTQIGAVYRLEGTDDRCGAGADQASVIGTAFLNPDGSIGFGLNIVSTPEGRPAPLTAEISLATLSGTWRDGGGSTGSFVFTPGAGTGGSPRPVPAPSSTTIPAAFGLLNEGQFVARGTIGTGNIPASGNGVRMMWHPAKAAFRVGQVSGAVPAVWNDNNIGINSTAFGFDTLAAGAYSTAFGSATSAVGPVSTAMGTNTQALGAYSTAMGGGTTASGNSSTAMGSTTRAQGQNSTATGNNTTASGLNSVSMGENTVASGAHAAAMGYATTASGFGSLAMGSNTQAIGAYSVAGGANAIARGTSSMAFGNAETVSIAHGSFAFGDISTNTRIVSDLANQFVVRASGGVGFYTNPAMTLGVELDPNDGTWNTLSDRNRKEHFRDLPGEDVLDRLSRIPIQRWSYKTGGPAATHVGPTAQDFYAAFGLGTNPLRISSVDADGIALAGVKALDVRTRDLLETNRMLADDNRQLREANDELRVRIERLERLLGGK